MLTRQLVSLKESMDAVDRQETFARATLDSLASALVNTEDHILAHWPDRPAHYKNQLRATAAAIKNDPTLDGVQTAATQHEVEVRECGEWMKASLAASMDLREVLSLLAQTSKQVREGGSRQEQRLGTLAADLSDVAQMNDIHAVRGRIASEVKRLVVWVEETRRENESILASLDQQLNQYRAKLETAECLAATDPLTGLGNRREMERRAGALIAIDAPFCIILFDLNKFKQINDTHGHPVGDEVLVSFAGRLRGQLRPADFACRWGGDEFLVLMASPLRDVMFRSRQIQGVVCGKYSVGNPDKPFRLEVGASVGLAERRKGESLEETVRRADVQMYNLKANR
ncbi:MAG: GGDEF domain-containing protein [Bryobacterales bacterium]|nr:GGDEF domain-containing protein [Bryobacterales bacterium]